MLTYLAVYAFVEDHSQRPPICFCPVALSSIHFRGKVCESSGLTGQRLAWRQVCSDILNLVSASTALLPRNGDATYKVCQVNVTIGIQQYVIRLHIPVNNVLLVHIPQSTAKFCDPESYGFFRKRLSSDMKPQVTTSHEIDNNVSVS